MKAIIAGTELKDSLTERETERLRICTKTILACLSSQFDGGLALIEVQDTKLYRENWPTFEAYCLDVLKISRSRAYQLIEGTRIKSALPPAASKLIVNEGQARALASVPEESRVKVINAAAKSGSITAATLTEAASQMSTAVDTVQPMNTGISLKTPTKSDPLTLEQQIAEKKAKSEVVLDDTGTVIPADGLPFWKRRSEIQAILTELSRIKCLVEKAKADCDPMFGKVSNAVIDSLNSAYSHLLEAKPYAVCTQCMGTFTLQPTGCGMCGNKGLISKYQWDTQSRKEIKEVRLKANGVKN